MRLGEREGEWSETRGEGEWSETRGEGGGVE